MAENKKYRIALVSNNAWSIYNFRLDVVRAMHQLGHEIIVISPHDEFVGRLENEGCLYQPVEFDNRSTNPLNDINLYFRLKRLYRKYRPDLIFHYVAKPNIYGTIAARRLRIPSIAVVTGLGYAFAKQNWLYYFVKHLYKRSLGKASEVWFLNRDDAQIFKRSGIVDISKIKVLPGEGVNTDFFRPVDKEQPGEARANFRFVMACRLLKSKGVGLFAEACLILKNKGYDFQADLLGLHEPHHPDGIASADLQKWQEAGLINYLGFVSDVRAALEQSDCFVFPSYYHEGVPRCLMEAASMELPIVTTHNRGCKEVVEEKLTGFLCKTGDPFDLADKMEQVLLMPAADRATMGRKGRELVISKFDIKKVQQAYIQIINRTLG